MEHNKPKKIVLGLLFTLAALYICYKEPIQISYADGPSQKDTVKYTIPEMVTYYADKYNVDHDLAHYIAKHESNYDPNDTGDLKITCRVKGSPGYGKAVYARGVYQITRCYYPEISDEMAFDPSFNIDYAMKVIAKGKKTCMSQFSTCRDYYSS